MPNMTGVITTLSELHQSFSDFVDGGTVPSTTDALYTSRTRWFNQGREDLAHRFFWNFLLKSDTISITAGNDGPYALPVDLTRPNALKMFKTQTGEIDFTDPYETSGNYLTISRDFTTGRYQVTLNEDPAANDTADIDYYATPTPLSAGADLVLVDGMTVLFYGLYMHFFSQGNLARMAELRNEYENRISEISRLEAINPPGAQTSMRNFEKARHLTSEKGFYSGNTRRS